MDKSREQFEEEFIKRTVLSANDILKIDDDTGEYHFIVPHQAWYWWQASRDSLEIELPDVSGVQHAEYDNGYGRACQDIEEILISNGVKIKNN